MPRQPSVTYIYSIYVLATMAAILLIGAIFPGAVASLLSALIAALALLLFTRRLAKPMSEIQIGAKRLAEGDLNYRLPLATIEEFETLASALNEMSSALGEKIHAIESQRNELNAVLSSMVEGVLAVDKTERVMRFNQASVKLLQLDSTAAPGRPVTELVRNYEFQTLLREALQDQKPHERSIVFHAEQPTYLQATASPLRNSRGECIGALAVINDITSIKKLENIRRDFVANVSHELRTPITSIKGFVETLLEGALNDPADARRFLEIIHRQTLRLNSLIEDLLSLSRIEQGQEVGGIRLQHGNFITPIKSALQTCESLATVKNISIKAECDPGLQGEFNAALLEQALINLLENAVKYSDEGRNVTLRVVQDICSTEISVEDQGCGIPAPHLPRIFERFYRVDRARSRKLGGTGLGLAIVKHIATAHNGSMSVQSSVGKGSVFTISLPRNCDSRLNVSDLMSVTHSV